jgi:predicted PurR-regulated permease PerM
MTQPRSVRVTSIERWITLAVLAALMVGCYLVLQPFLLAIALALILCCTTWPLYLHMERATQGRASLSALILTLVIALVVLAPFLIVGLTLADNARQLVELWRRIAEEGPPDPPSWVANLPLIGAWAYGYWAGLAHDNTQFFAAIQQYFDEIRFYAIAGGKAVVQGILQLTFAIVLAFFIYRYGKAMAMRLFATVERIAGARGKRLIEVGASTMRGVVYGILGTALVQGVLAAIGFWMAGVPAAPLLGLITFFVSPAPMGPVLVWAPAAVWLFNMGATGWGVFMLAWGFGVVSTVDNFIKPLIISRGSNLPFVLVLLGVLGGVIAFGFIGVFLGPTLLAVGYALLLEWSEGGPKPSEKATKDKGGGIVP